MVGATSPARDAAAIRTFYLEKLGFTAIDRATPARLRMPGDSGHEVDVVPGGAEVKSGVQFSAADLKHTLEVLTSLGLAPKAIQNNNATLVSITDPDGVVVSFVRR
jgi:catechol 2,3-dioxygenase-like lactoylglutathione lyase family enzyme